ncbi:MAG: hypothetical protein ACR2OJ_02330 [Hyphomicrobiales bacterium]
MNSSAPRSVGLRARETVMRLARLGAFHQTRLSFMRVLLRRLKREGWQFDRPVWEIDAKGVGHGVYCARGPQRTYSLIVFAHDLDAAKRSDRVIAEEWDATFTLFDGVPTNADIARLEQNVPKQEAGRVSETELSLSRANRSVRLFEYVKSCLARGEQPDAEELDKVGYLMRTTAVYGSGKFGALDYRFVRDREEFSSPFQVEMLSVFLTRAFTIDIVEHLAAAEAPKTCVSLASHLKRRLGVGNSTGLGMAPFLVNHPALIHQWIEARETALSRVRAVEKASSADIETFANVLKRQSHSTDLWHTASEPHMERIMRLREDLKLLEKHVRDEDVFENRQPWDALYLWGQDNLSLEGQELLVSLILEPHGSLIDDLASQMSADEQAEFRINGSMRITELRELLNQFYEFADEFCPDNSEDSARFWYVSEEKLEPRLGERREEPGADLEFPLAISRDAAALISDCDKADDSELVAAFLLRHPEHRHLVRRVQLAPRAGFSEIHDNMISSELVPIDLLRCKLSFFGATHFDPRSDRWVRITMYQNAPYPDELAHSDVDRWVYPDLEVGH